MMARSRSLSVIGITFTAAAFTAAAFTAAAFTAAAFTAAAFDISRCFLSMTAGSSL